MARHLLGLVTFAALVAACGSTNVTPAPTPSAQAITSPTQVPVTAPPPTPVGSSVDAAPCEPGAVAVAVHGEGAGGSIALAIDVTNTGSAPCALTGAPSSLGLRAGGGSLPISYQPRPDPWPGTSPDVVAPPVVLPPNWKATARAIWSNWCLGAADVSTVWVGLTGEAIDTSPDPTISAPRCDNDKAESTVVGFPFEPDQTGG